LKKEDHSDIKEEKISKNEGTIFKLYLGSKDEKEKMEWNDMKIVQSNQLTNEGIKVVASFPKCRKVQICSTKTLLGWGNKCSCVTKYDHIKC
jgi:hypothetical protein